MNMLQNMLMKKMLKSQLKDVPEEQQEQLFRALEKNPEFFQNLAEEIKKRIDAGEDKMQATMAVMQGKQDELKRIVEEA
jgi:predicted Holliday junction resolvase-like endonuclease